MRIIILTADYESFLKWHYMRHPGLENESYEIQIKSRFDTLFGVSDFYSRNFSTLGHQASEIYVNNIWLQTAWAREYGLDVPMPISPQMLAPTDKNEMVMRLKRKLRPYERYLSPLAKRLGYVQSLSKVERQILMAQITQLNPDVILNQIPGVVTSDIMHAVKRPGRIIVVQHGNQPPDNFDASPYNFGISLIPAVVEYFRSRGIPAANTHLAFDRSVLERLGPPPLKDIDVSFVGGLASNHTKRIALLEGIARELPIELYLSSFTGIAEMSPLHAHVKGEVWGEDMYQVLRRSKITLNSHIDAANGMAGNMRLYEATGVGSFLLTDNLPNLPTLFKPGIHLDTYENVQECVAKIKYYLSRDAEREKIARAGQEHTLTEHTYGQRVEELLMLIGKNCN